MGRRGVVVEGPNNGGSVEEVREHLIDLGVLLPVVAFGIFFGIPEAERQNTIRFGVRCRYGKFVQDIEAHHVLVEYKRSSFCWLSSLTWGKSNPTQYFLLGYLFLDVDTSL